MKCNIWILEMSQIQNVANKEIIEAGKLFRICVRIMKSCVDSNVFLDILLIETGIKSI